MPGTNSWRCPLLPRQKLLPTPKFAQRWPRFTKSMFWGAGRGGLTSHKLSAHKLCSSQSIHLSGAHEAVEASGPALAGKGPQGPGNNRTLDGWLWAGRTSISLGPQGVSPATPYGPRHRRKTRARSARHPDH